MLSTSFPHPKIQNLLSNLVLASKTMPSSFHFLILILCSILYLISPSKAKPLSKPKALVVPVIKDSNQYVTQLDQRTPLVPIKLTLDLGGRYLWVHCDADGYVSSTYKPIHCGSPQCSLANATSCRDCFDGPESPGCHNNTCRLLPENTIILRTMVTGEVSQDIVTIQSTNGHNPSKVVTLPKFLFSCATFSTMLEGLADGVKGMAGLGRSNISLPFQFSSAFAFPNKFAICLSRSTTSNGVVFFGASPYVLLPGIDVSKKLIHTPLFINPKTTASSSQKEEPSSEYFIGVSSIKINGATVPLNNSLLTINSTGFGGTKITTANPYTVLEHTIYNNFVKVFEKQVGNVTKVAPISPFGLCYNSKSFGSTRVGPGVPPIDLVLQKKSVFWRIFGANSMVQVNNDVLCLGFLKGRTDFTPQTSIVIGAHQLEDNLLQFDLVKSRLGFSSSLLFRQTTCGNFNFTSIA
ncbi:basic 7S globulin-like [Quillaja saponaria]|uniref:Basic 7S globulin-like n=1 Tax=Quillaja saponaria TaxID=32244 RepID=A0AAD7QEM4_QUISA|nr:basic 7S globulin-like [Quillaja saponaria]